MRQILIALMLAACCSSVRAQAPLEADLGARVDEIAKRALSRPVAGISIAIARNGQIVLARGYGLSNIEHSVAVTPDTVFHIDSISKNIAAAVVLRLADEGKLSLDDVTKYVPNAPTHGRHVAVRDLLNHTSGIFNYTSLPDAEDNERRDLTHEQVLDLIANRPPDFEPRTSWRYDNSAFYLAGMVVERVTGQEYGAYLREHVFGPLGMSSAALCDARTVVPRLAQGYEADHGSFVNAAPMSWKVPFAAGSVCATATDLLRWEAALDGGRVVSPASLAQMRAQTRLADGMAIDYGLGTRLGSLDGHRALGHTGSGGGFSTALISFPDDHLTIAVLVNTDSGGPTTAGAIARAVLGLPEETERDEPLSTEEAAALPGTFESDEGTIENFVRDGKLWVRFGGPSGAEVPLRHKAEYVFETNGLEVRFVVRDGRAVWGMAYSAGLMFDAKRRVR